jgi:3-phenylpropionate/trans-cinnamate dioxygenase ferredoxin subunit
MAEWVDVAGTDEIAPGAFKVIEVDGAMIAVFNLNGKFYAIEDVCTHDGGTLSGGELSGDEVICPRHGARFDIRSGAVTAPPAYEPVHCFPLRVQDSRVQVRDDRWD